MANSREPLYPHDLLESLNIPEGYAYVFEQALRIQAFGLFIHVQPPISGSIQKTLRTRFERPIPPPFDILSLTACLSREPLEIAFRRENERFFDPVGLRKRRRIERMRRGLRGPARTKKIRS